MNLKKFLTLVTVISLLFPVQFLLGMAVNLFIKIPKPVVIAFFTSGGGSVLDLHIINGTVILTLAITIIVLAHRMKSRLPFKLSILAITFIVLSIASGIVFLFFGQKDVFSYTMSVGMAAGVVTYSFVGKTAMQANK